MLKQGGIADTQGEFVQDHEYFAKMLQSVAKDVLSPDHRSHERGAPGTSKGASQSCLHKEGHNTTRARTASTRVAKRKEEPAFSGTWKEWCQAERGSKQVEHTVGEHCPAASSMGTRETDRGATQSPSIDSPAEFRSTPLNTTGMPPSTGIEASIIVPHVPKGSIPQQWCPAGLRSGKSGCHLGSQNSRRPRKLSAKQRKQVDRELSADKEVVIEVDWTLGQAAPHIATITAQSTPLSWRLQAALELTMCELPILQDTYMIVGY